MFKTGLVLAINKVIKTLREHPLRKLSIILTLVSGLNVLAIDTIDIVRNDIWNKFEAQSPQSQLVIQLGESWSEELEYAVNLMEEH